MEDKLKEIVGKKVQTGNFIAEVKDDYSVEIRDVSGSFKLVYGKATYAWSAIIYLISEDEAALENLIKIIIYPTVMRIHEVDSEFLEDILKMHNNLNERLIAEREKEHREEDDIEALSFEEALYAAYHEEFEAEMKESANEEENVESDEKE